jgi:galactokinase
MTAVIDTAIDIFRVQFGDARDTHVGWAPGRINLIGEYTDINNGFVLPMTIDLGIAVVVRARTQPGMSLYADAFNDTSSFSLADTKFSELPLWARYVAGVAFLSLKSGCDFSGFDVVIYGNIPIGGGVSSSAALTTATAMAIQSATNWSMDPIATAKMCQAVEHRFAAVMCGIMDQMAVRLGKANSAIFIDCASLEWTRVPMEQNLHELLIVDSGVPRSLHESEYNARSVECGRAVEALRELGIPVNDLRGVSSDMLDGAADDIDRMLLRRIRHVVSENQRVVEGRRAIETRNYESFGKLMNESHESLRSEFEVSVRELDFITEIANKVNGVLGARLTGAGFGGNAIVLTEPGIAEHATATIQDQFSDCFGRIPRIHRVGQSTEAQGYRV